MPPWHKKADDRYSVSPAPVVAYPPPNLCAFAALRDIFLVSLAICLEGVNMVLRTFRYGFYKPAYAVESG
jgi:hypothetical protein